MENNRVVIEGICSQLEKLTLFELTQLNSIINKMTEDEERNNFVKRQLKSGMTVSYFNSRKNKVLDAVFLDVNKTRVRLKDLEDEKKWMVRFKSIDLEESNIIIKHKQKNGTLDKYTLKLGDIVTFESNDGIDLYGVVKKLNPKRSVIELRDGHTWNVPYKHLSLITDGVSVDSNGCLLIEG